MRRALAGPAAVLAAGCGGSSQPAAVPHPSDLAAKIHGCHSYAATEAPSMPGSKDSARWATVTPPISPRSAPSRRRGTT